MNLSSALLTNDTLPNRFAFGGVAFALTQQEQGRLPQTEFLAGSIAKPLGAPVAAWVDLQFSERKGTHEKLDTIQWNWQGHASRLQAGEAAGELNKVAANRYAAHFVVPARDAESVNAAVAAASSAILLRQGGLLIHAAAVELDGQALLFVGPSGVGKTTASSQMRSCAWLAVDRVALVAAQDRWWVWRLPWGNRQGLTLERSAAIFLPLAGILRVRQASTVFIESCSRLAATMLLRESLRTGSLSVADEEKLLQVADQLSQRHPVGIIDVALGSDLVASVRSWLITK